MWPAEMYTSNIYSADWEIMSQCTASEATAKIWLVFLENINLTNHTFQQEHF